MSKTITNYDDTIDSRDLMEYMDTLRDNDDADVMAELALLDEFAGEFENYAEDYLHGEIAIHSRYFTEYCRDMVHDIGYMPDSAPAFITDNIDWRGVADDLKADYSDIEFNGQTYYVR